MGTLDLCLRVPEKMQKTRDESDPNRLKKLPKTAPKPQNINLADFDSFWTFSQSGMIGFISAIWRHKFRVPTRHTYKFLFCLLKGIRGF